MAIKTIYSNGKWRVDRAPFRRSEWIEIEGESSRATRGPANRYQLRRNLDEGHYKLKYNLHYVLSHWLEEENGWKAVAFFGTEAQACAVATALEIVGDQVYDVCKFKQDLQPHFIPSTCVPPMA